MFEDVERERPSAERERERKRGQRGKPDTKSRRTDSLNIDRAVANTRNGRCRNHCRQLGTRDPGDPGDTRDARESIG